MVKGKLQDYVMTIWEKIFQFIQNNIANALHDILKNCYGLEMNQTNYFKLLNNVLRDPRVFHK